MISDFRHEDFPSVISSDASVAEFLAKAKEFFEANSTALKIATHVSNNSANLKLTLLNDEDTMKTVTIDNLNADQIQSVKLRGPDVSLMFEGKGMAFVQVIRRYRNNDGNDEMKAFTDSCDGEETKGDSGYVWYIGFAVLIAVLIGLVIAVALFIVKRKRSREPVMENDQ
jgi:hypothetical protein